MFSIIEIDIKICVGCAYCEIVCPTNSFKVEGVATFSQNCIKCLQCIRNCPVSALKQLWGI